MARISGDGHSERVFHVDEAHRGMRLDLFLSEALPDATRSFLKKVIKDGGVTVKGQPLLRPSRRVGLDEQISVVLPPAPTSDLIPEDIPLEVLYEDADVLIINKPSGLVVHPAPGHYTGTLVHAVLYHCANFERPTGTLSGFGADPLRPGIIHRLDRFTSGVMVVAKTQTAFDSLSKQAREHTFDRRYLALLQGEFKEDRGVIRASIGRSLSDRGRMAVTGVKSREAVTHFHVVERFGIASVVSLRLETGRTHQIRVHLRFAGRPILGDPVYGITDYHGWKVGEELRSRLESLEGQALHAELLGITHPVSGERLSFTAPPPEDFQAAQDALRAASLPCA
jgi:23S rRNA pseudouridine1911/1915/1917 synthase